MALENKRIYAVVFLLLIVLAIQLFLIAKQKSITVDEISQIPSGYSYLKTHEIRLNIEAEPLVNMINAFPLLFINPILPLNHSSWILAKDNEFRGQYHWEFGEQFFYNYGNEPDTILLYSRMSVIILSVILGFLIFLFSKELFGVKAGIFSLFLYILNPTILAHSSIATIDIGSALFVFLAVYFFWRFVNNISLKYLLIAGITFGLAELSKFTALFLIPVYLLLTIITIIKKRKQGIKLIDAFSAKNSIILILLVFIIFFIGGVVVVLGYFIFSFPKYFEGISYVKYHSDIGHPAYLLGERSRDGWWYYYLVAFLIKEPLPLLVFILLTLIFYKKIRHNDILNEYFLTIPIILLVFISFFTKINIGIRHLLPIYPFIFLFVGRVVNSNIKKTLLFLIIGGLSLWYALSSLSNYPHHLAYFNELIPREHAPRYLLDSNIDWGQDLKGLKNYLIKNNITEIRLGYWGKDKPEYRNINYKQINCYPEPGIAVVSVNNLYGISKDRAECLEWLMDYKPIADIGYSILIYNISNVNVNNAQTEYCFRICNKICSQQNLNYLNSSFFNESCECSCG